MSLLVSYESSEDESENEDDQVIKANIHVNKKSLILPKPKTEELHQIPEKEFESTSVSQIKTLLPPPKKSGSQINIVEDENDEFLNKKAVPLERPPNRVKITIPSLSDFKDLQNHKTKTNQNQNNGCKSEGLLSLLPKPKSESFYHSPATVKPDSTRVPIKTNTFLIPESVKNKNSTSVGNKKLPIKKKLVSVSDSDDSEEESDFFSLQKETILPTVNINEINEMVSKKAAEMAKAFKELEPNLNTNEDQMDNNEPELSPTIDKHKAIQFLSGSKEAKRRKTEDIQFIELTADQVMPNKSEWYRTALASSTSYQRRGIVDEEDQPGTRRKNQITYLANQALANDSELQAMWSENRANRRATQNKYGF